MRRILIFGLVGPILSYLIFTALSGVHVALLARSIWFALPIVFAVLEIPFLICAFIDFLVENARWWERLLIALLSGFGLSFVAVFSLWPSLAKADWHVLQFGIIGAVPALVCSWWVSLRSSNDSQVAN